MNLKVGTRLKSKHSGKVCTVTDIDEKWDRFGVEWDVKTRGCKANHEISKARLYFTIVKSTTNQIERADEFLRRANSGLDDNWRDYD